MDSTESCVPPGFRFHPTDEELVGYYLKKKVASQKIDLDVIRDIDLYRIEPWDLQERCRIGYEEQREWYFFSHKDKKYPTGTRTNRATLAGFWKATGRDKAVHDKGKLIGMRKTLVFYKGRAPNGQKSDWIMHEYRLDSEENAPPQEEGWVVCRAFKKRTSSQPAGTSIVANWMDSTYCLSDPLEYLYMQQPRPHLLPLKNLQCKQETELEALNSLHSTSINFINQLPQLKSPSLPPVRRPSLTSISCDHEVDGEERVRATKDWRDLDKFVASQLSHEERLGPTSAELEQFRTPGDYGVDVSHSDLAGLLSSDGFCTFEI